MCLKNNSRQITYGIGCVWGIPLSSLVRKPIKIVTDVIIEFKFRIGIHVIHDSNVILW